MLGSRAIRAHKQQTPIRQLRKARPNLLTVDDEVVAVADGLGAERGQVAAGVRLRKSLTPNLLAGENRRQVTFLLLLRAQHDDRWTNQREANRADQLRGVGVRQLFLKDGLLHDRRAAPAVLLRPGNAGPSAIVKLALPLLQVLDVIRPVFRIPVAHPLRRRVGREPRAEFVAELLLIRG